MKSDSTVAAAFSEEQTARLSGATRRQLQYWDRTALFCPSYREEAFHSFGRIYSFQDVVALKVLAALRNIHDVSTQQLRLVKEQLARHNVRNWTGVRLYVHNRRVIWHEPGTEMPQEIASGQWIFKEIDLQSVIGEATRDAGALRQRPSGTVGRISKERNLNNSAAVVAGTRIPVKAILSFHKAGFDADAIIREYPDLTQADVEAALQFEKAA